MAASDPLRRVTRAAESLSAAREEYRAALFAAREAGATFTAIGGAAGVSKQAARKLLT